MLNIRVDASPEIGGGHAMRCIALAQAWRRMGGEVRFVSAVMKGTAADRLRREGFDWTPAAVGGRRDQEDGWWVVDLGHRLSTEDFAECAERTLLIDDLGRALEVPPRLVLNQNLHASSTAYPGVPDDRVLRGLDYVLLRDEFLVAPSRDRAGPVRRVLVALGASDPSSQLVKVVSAAVRAGDFEVVAVASGAHPDREHLLRLAAEKTSLQAVFDVTDMSRLIATADLAVTSGGTTVWELAYHGVPALVGTVSVYEERLAEGLAALGLNHVLGTFTELGVEELVRTIAKRACDTSWYVEMSRLGRRLVDGRGRDRVLDELIKERRT